MRSWYFSNLKESLSHENVYSPKEVQRFLVDPEHGFMKCLSSIIPSGFFFLALFTNVVVHR